MIALCFVCINVMRDEYGLFWDTQGKSYSILHNDRYSKYLFSFNYIPQNFDAFLMGPSVSAEIDVRKLRGLKVYNISLGGGNVTELKYLAENIIQRGRLKAIIICLYPYMTKDHGCKTTYIHPQVYWGALGSRELLNFYVNKVLIHKGWRPRLAIDDYGYLRASRTGMGVTATKTSRTNPVGANSEDLYVVDEQAYRELDEIIQMARRRQIKIFGYYHPVWLGAFDEQRFLTYKTKIDHLFGTDDMIWDMNTDDFIAFRGNPDNYNQTAHLTEKGADFVRQGIQDKLDQYFQFKRREPR
jgi:hypothetical protein